MGDNEEKIVCILSTNKEGVYKVCSINKISNIDVVKTLIMETCNDALLEEGVHYILDRYKCNSNREHFRCDLSYIKMVTEVLCNLLNLVKSSDQNVSSDELNRNISKGLFLKSSKNKI